MPVSLKDFARSLAASSLLSGEDIRDFLGTFPSEKRPKSAQDLARELIRVGKLTKYQAMEVYHGRTKGLVLGNYVILDKIGAGGMGQVFKAQHKVMEREVALKVLPQAAVKSEQSVQRFHREVKAAAKLEHPNIVTAYDADESNGIHFLVMQCVDGSDLSHIVTEHGPLAVETAVDCILQAARGLEYAHKQGVVHRDIKPANVLVDKEGTVKILDMGLARMFEGEEGTDVDRLTESGQVMGTCDYMAPEQAEDSHGADHRADIYSLGCTLYRIVTGKKPYTGESLIQILMAHQGAPIPSMCEARPDVPASLDAVYQKMVAKRPDDRYQSMTEVIAALEACVAKERQPLVSEASSDSALTSFLQNLSEGGVATRRPAARVAEDTIPHQTKPETETNIWRKILPVDPRQRKLLVGIAAGAAFLVLLFGVVLSLRTPDGTLIVEISEPEAVVQVLDEKGKVEIERKGKKGKLSISIDPGKHRLKVEKDGFQFFTENFEIESGGKTEIRARLEPLGKKRAVASAPPNAKTSPVSARPAAKVVARLEPVKTLEGEGKITSVAFSPDGAVFVFGDVLDVRMLNTSTWELRPQAGWGKGLVRCVAFSADGSLLAVSRGSGISVHNVATGKVECKFGGHSALGCLGFSPDGSLLTSLDKKEFIGNIWDVRTAKLRQNFPADGGLRAVAWSPSGSILACGTDAGPELWDVKAGKTVAQWKDTDTSEWRNCVDSIAVSPDGAMVATGHGGGVRIWDLRVGQLRHRIATQAGKAYSVAFSRDGSVLAGGCEDGTVTLWNPTTGGRLITFQGHTGIVRDVTFSPDGRLLATGSDDGTATIWDVSKFLPPKAPTTQPPLAIAPFTPEEAKQHQETWAKHLGVPVVEENSVGMKMVLIPPGEFMMGSSEEEIAESLKKGEEAGWLDEDVAENIKSEGPQHKVRITKPFRLAAHEVTVGQFKAFVESAGYETDAERRPLGWGIVSAAGKPGWEKKPEFNWKNVGAREQTDQHPVVNVNWRDALAFCEWLSEKEVKTYRLPTEAQWEYACRSGSTTRWFFGDNDAELGQYAWYEAGPISQPVGGKLPNAFGLFDMHGNLREWCSDWFSQDFYASSAEKNPEGPEGPAIGVERVLRGGMFACHAWELRSAHRCGLPQEQPRLADGFRPVLVMEPTDSKPTPAEE